MHYVHDNFNTSHIIALSPEDMMRLTCLKPNKDFISLSDDVENFLNDNKLEHQFHSWFITFTNKNDAMFFKTAFQGFGQ